MPTPRSLYDSARIPVAAPDDVSGTILSNEWVNDEYKRMVVKADGTACQAQPGQFFTLRCPTAGGTTPFFRRPMSTYKADPLCGEVEFLYKVTGTGTEALSQLRSGEALEMLGPLGKGFRLHSDWRHIIIVARGVGLATLAPLAEAAHAHGIAMSVILSARSAQALLKPSQRRFERLGAYVRTALDDDGSSHPRVLEHTLRTLLDQHPADALFTCGSKRLTALLRQLASDYGITGQVALEEQMVCGLGMCQCCTKVLVQEGVRVSKRVCVDGPVFNLTEVEA